MKDKFSTNLLVSSLVFTLLVSMYVFFGYFDKTEELQTTILSQQEEISDKDQILDSFGELAMIYPENRAMVVAIAYTESRCDLTVVHTDKSTKGIGGIKTLWDLECKDSNSLLAIEEVIEKIQYANPTFTPYQVIKFYKGAKTNLGSTNQAYEMYVALKMIM